MDILISEELNSAAIQRLGETYSIIRDPAIWKSPGELRSKIAEARTIMVRNQTQLTEEALAAAPNLIGIGRVGVGLDNIDVEAASKQGVVVIAPLDANAVSVAELAFGLLLALARKIPTADRTTKAGGWERKTCTGIELQGKTVTICGLGRIGRLVAQRAMAFGMAIRVFDPFIRNDAPALTGLEVMLCPKLQDALARADFVTVHSPLTSETKHMFNETAFAWMQRGAFFINTSRGGVMDEVALLGALQSGQLGGAALDVREVEPPAGRSEFEKLENVILTPHIGAFTAEAQTRTIEAVCGDLDRLLRGQAAVNFVNFATPRR